MNGYFDEQDRCARITEAFCSDDVSMGALLAHAVKVMQEQLQRRLYGDRHSGHGAAPAQKRGATGLRSRGLFAGLLSAARAATTTWSKWSS
jgi:hypothetical protein